MALLDLYLLVRDRFARNLFAALQSRHQVVVYMTILFPIARPFASGAT